MAIDCNWQTNVSNFFAVGEVAGSHGVYRPGGSALNAGQVGSTRCAEYISNKYDIEPIGFEEFRQVAIDDIKSTIELSKRCFSNEENVRITIESVTKEMSQVASCIRNVVQIEKLKDRVRILLEDFTNSIKIKNSRQINELFRLKDILICQYVYLSAMVDYINNNGKSRGGALCSDSKFKRERDCVELSDILDLSHRTVLSHKTVLCDVIQEVEYTDSDETRGRTERFYWRKVRPIPKEDDCFEVVLHNSHKTVLE